MSSFESHQPSTSKKINEMPEAPLNNLGPGKNDGGLPPQNLKPTIDTINRLLDALQLTPTQPAELEPTMEKKLERSKLIRLRQMDPNEEWVYKNRVLYLTLGENEAYGFPQWKDENGDSANLVFDLPEDDKKKIRGQWFCGQRLAIMNPYMRYGVIRADELENLAFLKKKKITCNYCFKENPRNLCGKCKKTSYCSKDCQVSDWKDHKRLCKLLV